MKFKDYVKNLNELLKKRPEVADYDVVTSRDDEGNGYNLVYYGATVGSYDKNERDFKAEQETNAVCVN